ncbi:hypothetical protein [Flagellimonas okinawensis]|uniref:Uncharacterized protein n=1 Tax=Flagellimonas okinawensis TaxID=3031324 RepID=A0ABT5XRI1_9FLAO|nr:hypothetical protein [[Muricauda] okinawensis]MDF0708496.1 hypothetical protein [[Muricauda] okinawensis]
MRTLKIIIGFLLLWGTGAEYVAASREAGSWYSAGVIGGVIILLLVCTWLIGTGFSATKYKLTKIQFLKYFGIAFGIFFCFAFLNVGRKIVPSNFVTVNGLRIPLGKCIDGNKRLIPDDKQREEFCKCFVEKLTDNTELKEKYKSRLESDKIIEVFKEVQQDSIFLSIGLDDCYGQNMEWTERLADSMRKNWKNELVGTEFEETNDIEKYCDCLIDEYQKYPFKKVMGDNFADSPEAISIDEKCTELSKK